MHTIKNKRGFTIVELLVVIVVIALLATMGIAAYNGVQGRSRDSRRVSDMNAIVKALAQYKTLNGNYPAAVSGLNASGWEVSTDGTNATNFLSALTSIPETGLKQVPVDPVNTGNSADLEPLSNRATYEYFYFRYSAGSYGCDATKGPYYVIGIVRMDTVASGGTHPSSPGFSCSGRNWMTHGAWITGGYTS